MTDTEMRKTWLVQRLEPARTWGFLGMKDNPFSFGGGLRNGGLTDEAMGLLRSIFSFDYMGSAEFEWGAVPKALQAFAADHGRLTAWSFSIALVDVAPHWSDKSKTDPEGEVSVFALARASQAEEVESRIRAMARQDYQLKEATHLPLVLRPSAEAGWTPETCGWLEISNGFFFFTDRDMWAATCTLFGVEVPSEQVSA